MLFCNRCGQCLHIGDDNFIEYRNTSGWEMTYIDPVDGDYVDSGDSEQTDSNHDNYECPHCNCNDIEFDWDGTEGEAVALRDEYLSQRAERNKLFEENRKKIEYAKKAKDPSRQWDIEKNITV